MKLRLEPQTFQLVAPTRDVSQCVLFFLYLRAGNPTDPSGDQIENLVPCDRPRLTLEPIKHMPF